HDNRLYAEIGLTYYLGKATWSRTPDVDAINAQHQAEVDALNAQVNELRNRKPEVVEKIVEKRVEVPASGAGTFDHTFIAFAQGKANLTQEDKEALDGIKEGTHVQIVGTASPDGSKAVNDRLSQARADVVAKYLKDRGVIVEEATGKGVQGSTSNRLAIIYVK
ncbi:OmpA family protein, partial [gut metagenome]